MLPEATLFDLELATALHDIGKMSVDERILLKKETLTPEEWGQIRKEQIVCVRVLDKRRTLLAKTIQPLDIERRLPYPQQVGLSMIALADTDTLLLRCEHYARCVSLHGDGFDTLFDDNFFDLIPNETRIINGEKAIQNLKIYSLYETMNAENQ